MTGVVELLAFEDGMIFYCRKMTVSTTNRDPPVLFLRGSYIVVTPVSEKGYFEVVMHIRLTCGDN